jgi:hypothetical protein
MDASGNIDASNISGVGIAIGYAETQRQAARGRRRR